MNKNRSQTCNGPIYLNLTATPLIGLFKTSISNGEEETQPVGRLAHMPKGSITSFMLHELSYDPVYARRAARKIPDPLPVAHFFQKVRNKRPAVHFYRCAGVPNHDKKSSFCARSSRALKLAELVRSAVDRPYRYRLLGASAAWSARFPRYLEDRRARHNPS